MADLRGMDNGSDGRLKYEAATAYGEAFVQGDTTAELG